MKKPKIKVDGIFYPSIDGLNAGEICSAYEAMADALILFMKKHRETYGLDGAYDEEMLKARQALKKAGCHE